MSSGPTLPCGTPRGGAGTGRRSGRRSSRGGEPPRPLSMALQLSTPKPYPAAARNEPTDEPLFSRRDENDPTDDLVALREVARRAFSRHPSTRHGTHMGGAAQESAPDRNLCDVRGGRDRGVTEPRNPACNRDLPQQDQDRAESWHRPSSGKRHGPQPVILCFVCSFARLSVASFARCRGLKTRRPRRQTPKTRHGINGSNTAGPEKPFHPVDDVGPGRSDVHAGAPNPTSDVPLLNCLKPAGGGVGMLVKFRGTAGVKRLVGRVRPPACRF